MSANWFSAFTKRRRFPAFCTSRSQISSSDHGSLCYSTVISANRVSGFVNSFRFPFFSSSPMTSLMSTTRCLSGRLLNVPSHLSLPTFVLPNCNSYHIPYKVNYRLLGTAPGFDKMDLKNNISTLVLGEHEGGFLKPSTLSAVSAASSISKNNSISILLGGSDSDLEKAASHAASVHPMVSQVLVANAGIFTHPLAEIWAGLVHMVQQKGGYSYIISASTSFGKNVLPRAAAILDVSPITDVTEISDGHLFVRPIYAGNALCKVRYTGSDPCMMTIRSTSFPALSIPTEASFDAAPISQE